MDNVISNGNTWRQVLQYVFTGTEAAGTEIISGPLVSDSWELVSIEKVSETGIASTNADIGYVVTEGSAASNATFFAAAASLAAGSAVLVGMTAAGPLLSPPYLPWRLSVKTTTAAVAGNAGLTLRLVVNSVKP